MNNLLAAVPEIGALPAQITPTEVATESALLQTYGAGFALAILAALGVKYTYKAGWIGAKSIFGKLATAIRG